MDSFAVSLSSGVLMKPFKAQRALKFAFILAAFQALLPVAGWMFGTLFREFIESLDHWIALIMLVYLGCRMIYEAVKDDEHCCFDPCKTRTAMSMGLATSIDAMAVGISISLLNVDILNSAIVIGITTFLFSIAGVYIGHAIGCKLKKGAGILGGTILILIGIRIFLEHVLGL